MSVREDYLRALYRLSKSTPPEVWEQFRMSLNIYASDQIERAITGTPVAEIHIAVGYARYMKEFRDEIRNIETIIQKMDKERK